MALQKGRICELFSTRLINATKLVITLKRRETFIIPPGHSVIIIPIDQRDSSISIRTGTSGDPQSKPWRSDIGYHIYGDTRLVAAEEDITCLAIVVCPAGSREPASSPHNARVCTTPGMEAILDSPGGTPGAV